VENNLCLILNFETCTLHAFTDIHTHIHKIIQIKYELLSPKGWLICMDTTFPWRGGAEIYSSIQYRFSMHLTCVHHYSWHKDKLVNKTKLLPSWYLYFGRWARWSKLKYMEFSIKSKKNVMEKNKARWGKKMTHTGVTLNRVMRKSLYQEDIEQRPEWNKGVSHADMRKECSKWRKEPVWCPWDRKVWETWSTVKTEYRVNRVRGDGVGNEAKKGDQ
jgi:uncharacterized membrane protein